MSKFRLRIYRGPDKTSLAKWLKHDELKNWSRYQHFYCNGNESIISLDIGDVWRTMINNKHSHFEQCLDGNECSLQGKFITNTRIPFYIELDIQPDSQ